MEIAKMVSSLQILGLFLLCLCRTTSSYPVHRSMLPTLIRPFIAHDYLRFADVARQCQSVLSSAAELTVDAGRAKAFVDELSFANGDWHQDTGHAPLMPFHGSHAGTTEAHPGLPEATPLATFMLAHIDTVQQQRTRTALNVSGVLSLTIRRNCCCSDMAPHRHVSPEFKLQPGVAKLNILFEGVYTVTRSSGDDGGGGQTVLCMVGNAVLPMRSGNSTDPWDWAKNVGGGSFRPPVIADSNIVLMLRYPKAHTLTARAVRGEMMSTSAKSDNAYFDTVRLVSRFGRYSSYQFQPEDEELAVTGCSTHPFFCDDDVTGNCAGGLYRGFSFCDILHEFSPHDHGVLAVVPNWKCNSIDEYCSPLGPFETGSRATNTTDRAFTGFAIAMQDVRCEPTSELDGKAAARVSAVFRAVSPWEDQHMAVKRTGLNGMTLSAEGVWRASTGQLCMVGCLGIGKEACHYRVSLYVPTTFSVKRRGIFLGQITAMDGSHFPLSFQQNVPPTQPWNRVGRSEESVRVAYNYTKVEQAGELLRRSESSGFRGNIIATSLLSYPKRGAGTADYMSLSHLSYDLSFSFRYVPKLQFMPDQWIEDSYFQFQILSIGSLVGSYAPPFQRGSRMPVAQNDIGQGVERQQLLNVSAAFTVSRKIFGWSPVMSLEGVYNAVDGRMYLIGCRNVHAPWRVLSKIRDLEDGMDCSIEVKVEYPPTTARWLFGPTAKVCIASTRDADDPLHFNRTELHTAPVSYRGQGSDMLTEKTVEGLLCITMLSATVAAAINQLRYMKSHPNVVPYISLVMLGVQALGYGVTLVTEAQMLPAWPNYNSRFYMGHLHWGMDCSVKALTLAALLLTLRLAQKVWRSRIRARARSPLEPGRVPSDGAVLLYTFGVHLGGLLFVLVVHWLSTSGRSALPPEVLYEAQQGAVRAPTSCTRTRVERYVGLVKEWFLLPQVIGNAAWRVNCKPLRKRYYAGVTAVWLLPHVYGYLRPPVVSMYPELQDDVMDFYANVVDVVVPFIAVVLALSICVQQRWNYKIVGWAKARGQNKLQHVY